MNYDEVNENTAGRPFISEGESKLARAFALPDGETEARPNFLDPKNPWRWSAFHRELFPDASHPPKRWETDVAGYLFERRYHASTAKAILEYAHLYGSVECCLDLAFSAADRAAVEAKLPEVPGAEWLRYEDSQAVGLVVDLGELPLGEAEWKAWRIEHEEVVAHLALLL